MTEKGLIMLDEVEVVLTDHERRSVERVEAMTAQLRNLDDLVSSIFNRVQELKMIYLYNYNRGIKFEEMGPYEAPLDYKLNQLDNDVTRLRSVMGFEPGQPKGQDKRGAPLKLPAT